jgi:hypothetical protein
MFGAYEVIAPIGAGGMGEVYRARDTRLGREVAVKVLPDGFSNDPERVARFEREARVLASLNHPNIAAIYGLEQAQGIRCLVMELVPGETLSGPLPAEEALDTCRQVAHALEAAHEKGIIHRDLKPANIKITPDGKVKVLDFGLAKDLAPSGSDVSKSPTLTAGTQVGVVLGTAAYMAPEQARGKSVDRRADVWAFGCVLYECLTGKQAFGGETISDSIAAILGREPDWEALPGGTPAAIRRLLRRCLEKNPAQRLRDVGDARLEIEDALAPAAAEVGGRRGRATGWWIAAGILLAAVASAGGAWFARLRAPAPPAWSGVRISAPDIAFNPRISPDGQMLAYQAMVHGLTQVAVMKPESGSWAVVTRDRSRGTVDEIAWSRDGAKVYFDRYDGAPRGIFSVPALGGTERLVLADANTPNVLPDESLLVTRIDQERRWRICHFWPESGRIDTFPAAVRGGAQGVAMRGSPDGRYVAFLGRTLGPGTDPGSHLYLLEVRSGAARRLLPDALDERMIGFVDIDVRCPLAFSADSRWLVFVLPFGDLRQVVRIPVDGGVGSVGNPGGLVATTGTPNYLDCGSDGSLYLDLWDRSKEVVRIGFSTTPPERISASAGLTWGPPIELADGRVVASEQFLSRNRLILFGPESDPIPLVETREETGPAAVLIGSEELAVASGSSPERVIAIVAIKEGRITRRLKETRAPEIESLGVSPDHKTVYYASQGNVRAVPIEGGAPRTVHAGESVAVDPVSGDLVIQMVEQTGVRLVAVAPSGGPERQISWNEEARPAPTALHPSSVSRDGRIVVQVSPRDSWFWGPAFREPRTGAIVRAAAGLEADFDSPGWSRDGRIVAVAARMRSSIWRFRPVTSK